MNMKIKKIFLFALAFFTFLGTFSLSLANKLEVHKRPSFLYQGGVMLLEIKSPQYIKIKDVYFGKRTIPLKRERGRVLALLSAGLFEKPGARDIKIHYSYKGKRHIFKKRIVVKKKSYPKEYLKVPKKMASFPPDILKRVLDDQKAVKEACNRITKKIFWKGGFIWPLKKVTITSPFGLRRYFNGEPRSPHSGADLRARENTPIYSPNFGKVVLLRDCYLSGKTIVIDHGGGLFTLFAHLKKTFVKKGQEIKKGQIVALSGATGRITGPHLHYGISLLGKRVDPVAFMKLMARD